MVNRATEVYLTQMMPVSEIALREGMRAFWFEKPDTGCDLGQPDGRSDLLLTANTETAYAMSHLDLRTDGPTVIEAPPHMLGFVQDGLQRYVADIGPLRADKGKGGKFLVLPLAIKAHANTTADVRNFGMSIACWPMSVRHLALNQQSHRDIVDRAPGDTKPVIASANLIEAQRSIKSDCIPNVVHSPVTDPGRKSRLFVAKPPFECAPEGAAQ